MTDQVAALFETLDTIVATMEDLHQKNDQLQKMVDDLTKVVGEGNLAMQRTKYTIKTLESFMDEDFIELRNVVNQVDDRINNLEEILIEEDE